MGRWVTEALGILPANPKLCAFALGSLSHQLLPVLSQIFLFGWGGQGKQLPASKGAGGLSKWLCILGIQPVCPMGRGWQ